METRNETSNATGESVTLPTHRKFSESSLDKFATQFLKETDQNNSPKINQETLKTSDDLDKVSIDESLGNGSNNCSSPIPGPSRSIEKATGNTGNILQEVCSDGESSASGDGESHLGNKMFTSNDTMTTSSGGSVSPVLLNRAGGSNDAGANQNGGELVIAVVEPSGEFQLEQRQYDKPSGFLECHLEVMYYLGVSSYRREEYKPMECWVRIFQNVVFWIFCILSCIEFVCIAKNETVRLIAKKDLKYCVQFGYAMIRLIERCAFIYLIFFLSSKISVMLLNVRNMVQFQNDTLHNRFLKRTIFLVTSSLLLTFFTVLFGYAPFRDWDMEESIQSRTYYMSLTMFAWSGNSTKYEATENKLINEYYLKDMTWTHGFMGATEGIFDFCATLQGEMIRDLLLVAAKMLCFGWRYFEKRIESQLLIHPNNVDPRELEACVRHYRALRLASSSINEALRAVLNFHILENLFLYGYLTVQLITDANVSMRQIYLTIEALKATLTFYIALRTYWTNGNVRTWLRMLTMYRGPVQVESILGMTVQAALDDIRDNPNGFGSDYFLINETFLMGFFAVVFSLISMLMEFEKQ